MFSITCDTCMQRHLVGPRSLRSFRNTDGGPVALVECPEGHLVAHAFHAGTVTPAHQVACA